MSHRYKYFQPDWYTGKVPADSYRSIFKWGDSEKIKAPKETLYKMLKQRFKLSDGDFSHYTENLGLDTVEYKIKCKMAPEHIEYFKKIFGEKFVRTDDYARLSVAYGKTMYDLMRLRGKRIENIPDVVVYPDTKTQIEQLVAYCQKHKIPVYVYGGGSSVTRGVECMKGGVSLDMRLRFNKVIDFNETDQTITVQSGMSGPKLEQTLNNAVELYGAKRPYTCGHFPQSFEYSSVGGWVVTRGAGQNSTYYGTIADMVLSQEYATPIGPFKTESYNRKATGPDMNQLMMGGEGAFGVLTHVTLKFFRHMPDTVRRFSYMFRDWESAREAAREIMQSEAGVPSVFRLSDPEETDVMLRLYGVDESPLQHLLNMSGFKPMERCLFLGFTNGDEGYSKSAANNVRRVCRKYKALSLTGAVTESWEKGRFDDPYLRDTMQDFGVVTDTLECSVYWSNLAAVHKSVRAYCKSRPNTICMTHMSHVYPQGANLYFIFITMMHDPEEFREYHAGILDAIQQSGASMSHHHGIGKMFGPWLQGSIGDTAYGAIRALKTYFDPDNIMNPGGTLGLDTPKSQRHYPKENA